MRAEKPSNGRPISPDRMDESEIVALPHGTAAVFCDRSPFKDTPNEDGAIIVPVDRTRSVLAVADGMGGQPNGHEASEVALELLRRSIGADTGGGAGDGNLRA